MSSNYGVFSALTIELGEDGAEETLYRVQETKLEALVQLSRFVAFRAFHLIPHPSFKKLIDGLILATAAEDVSKGFNVAGVTYFVRELSEDDLKVLLTSTPTLPELD